MSKLFGSTPTPPNPIVTAAAQTATNIGTGITGSYLNNYNQVTPAGSLTYEPTGTYVYKDPTSGAEYNVPRWTATQTLSPSQNEINWRNEAAQFNLADTAKNQTYFLRDWLQGSVDPNSSPYAQGDPNRVYGLGDPARSFADTGQQQTSLGDYGRQQSTFGEAGDLTRSYGPADSFSADRARVEESLYGRLNPQLEQERSRLEQRLADQGIRYGSQAYNDAMFDFNQQANDARLAVTQTAGTEQQRMMDMAAKQAGFENAAQQQAYEQARGRGEFANKAQQQQFAEMLQAGTFGNTAQAQNFQQAASRAQFNNAALTQQLAQRQAEITASNAARQQWLAEQYASRNQPLNEISALMSGSQLAQPNWVNTGRSDIATTDVAGLVNNRFTQELDAYKQNSANFNNLMGGIFGAMGGVMLSDRREKEGIDKIGSVFAAGPDDAGELPIYEYSYKDDPSSLRHIGPMAQDIEKLDREAVKKIGGKKHIDVTRMGSILRAA